MKPLYMWAGGKGRMIPKYLKHPGIPLSGYDIFVEPFFGGGSMTIHILKFNPSIEKIIINDINEDIIDIYRQIRSNPNAFMSECDLICDHYLSLNKEDRKKFFYKVRESYIKDYTSWTKLKETATLYFLMKTSFNGIFQTKKDANGRFATPAGLLNHKDRVYDKANILYWHQALNKIEIYSGDWSDCISKIEGRAFIFMDPPYRNSFTQYEQDFDDEHQKKVIESCKQLDKNGHTVFYCNRDCKDSFYVDNKGDLEMAYYDTTYTAGRRATNEDQTKEAKKAIEILLFSSRLKNNG